MTDAVMIMHDGYDTTILSSEGYSSGSSHSGVASIVLIANYW